MAKYNNTSSNGFGSMENSGKPFGAKSAFAKAEWYPRQAELPPKSTTSTKTQSKSKKTQKSGRAVFKKTKAAPKRYARKAVSSTTSQQYDFDRKAAKAEI